MAARLNVVVCAPILGRDLAPLRAVDSAVNVIDGNAAFEAYNAARREDDDEAISKAEAAMRELLANADVLCMSYPMHRSVAALAPRLQWLHHTQAGVSNLWSADVWAADHITITSGRGHVRATAIAEYAVAGALSFARGIHDGEVDKRGGKLERARYEPFRVAGSTMGIVGLGGIGKEVARLSNGLGMRVIATRRSVEREERDVDGADRLLPAAELLTLARESDFIAVCTMLTRETTQLLDERFFAALARRPVLVNISRGEIVDEAAMLAALHSGRLRGAVLDVYAGELDGRPPRPELTSHPDIVLTPHISGLGDTEDPLFMELFRENLRRYVAGEPMINVVDRERGY
jgi:phosphoglycerate dehydrogenase-like enzyme